MSTITTKSSKRSVEVTTEMPNILTITNLDDLVSIIGAEAVVNKAVAQLTIDFRGVVRAALESESNGEFTNTVEDIAAMDFADWTPNIRQKQSAAEKASKMLSQLTPEMRALLKAQLEAEGA